MAASNLRRRRMPEHMLHPTAGRFLSIVHPGMAIFADFGVGRKF
jgi:hypothetical protein